jgi:hypothetical protein
MDYLNFSTNLWDLIVAADLECEQRRDPLILANKED